MNVSIRNQGHEPGIFDGFRKGALVLSTNATVATGNNH